MNQKVLYEIGKQKKKWFFDVRTIIIFRIIRSAGRVYVHTETQKVKYGK